MNTEELLELADHIQEQLHKHYLAGFMFTVEEVADIIKEFYEKGEN